MSTPHSPITLRGITWGHTRGHLPLVATAMRHAEREPGVRVEWERRSLQAFADQSVAELAARYDLLVIDHPSIGEAVAHGLYLPLDEHLPAAFLADQARHSVGVSHRSYQFAGDAGSGLHQWALAIDAATPVSASRPDRLEALGIAEPTTWDELLRLARTGRVALAGLALDMLMHFYSLCENAGVAPFIAADRLVDEAVAVPALEALRALADACGPECLTRNPIACYELLARSEQHVYSPFAYGYSNYARRGVAGEHRLRFGGVISRHGRPIRTTLGGAGLAVSARTAHREQAVTYAAFVASAEVQAGLYTEAGGQPGHRAAWLDPVDNRLTNHFFERTLPTLDAAWLRPRANGYIAFQDRGTAIMARYLRHEIDARACGAELDRADREWRAGRPVNDDAELHALTRQDRAA